MLGEVKGRRVLEAGSGAGQLRAWLADRGAVVTALAVSPAMAGLARQPAGDRAEVRVADLAQPSSFADSGSFALIMASLAMHYIYAWEAVLGEFRQVLKPDGPVVCSVHHPAMDWQLHAPGATSLSSR